MDTAHCSLIVNVVCCLVSVLRSVEVMDLDVCVEEGSTNDPENPALKRASKTCNNCSETDRKVLKQLNYLGGNCIRLGFCACQMRATSCSCAGERTSGPSTEINSS